MGESASIYGIVDATRNLRALPPERRRKAHLYLTAISVLSLLVGVFGHALFGFLSLLGLSFTPSRPWFVVTTVVGYVLIQVVMVAASVLVPVLSRKLRNLDDEEEAVETLPPPPVEVP